MGDKDKIKALYDQVSKDYDVGGYDDFATKMQDSAKRRSFYDFASKEYDLGDYNSFETNVKKKDSGIVSPVSSSPTAPTTSEPKPFVQGATQVPEEKIIKMPGLKMEDIHASDEDPVKTGLAPLRNEHRKALNEFQNIAPTQAAESTAQKINPDRILKNGKDYKTTVRENVNKSLQSLEHNYDQLNNTIFPTAKAAADYIQQKADKNNGQLPEDNETVQLAGKRISDYKNTSDEILNTNSIADAAINNARKNDPELDKQIGAVMSANHTSNSYEHNVPEVLYGKLVNNYLQNKDVKEFAENNPDFKDQYDDLKNNLITKYPEYGANVVANEISREREKRGMNSKWGIANFAFGHQDSMDRLAEDMYKNDPQKLQIYKDVISHDLNKYLYTPGFLDTAEGAVERGFRGTKKTVRELVGAYKDDSQREALDEKYNTINSGTNKVSEIAGDMAGTIAYMAAGGRVLGKLGVPSGVADKAMVGFTFFGDEKSKARLKYPGEPWKQNVSAGLTTAAFMAAANVFPASKVNKAIDEIRPTIEDVTSKLSSGNITREAAKSAITSGFEKALVGVKAAGKQNVRGITEMLAINALETASDKVLGLSDRAMNEFHPDGQSLDIIKTMAIGGALPSAITGLGAMKNRSMFKEYLNQMASEPNRIKDVLLDQVLMNPSAKHDVETKLNNLEHITQTKEDLVKNTTLPEELHGDYLLHSLNEKLLRERAEKVVDPTVKGRIEEQIKKSQQIKENILKGKTTDVLPQEDNLSAKEQKEVSGISNDQDLFDHFVSQKKEGYRTTLKVAEDMEDKKAGVKAGLDYMKDKAFENPILFSETWGNELTKKMLDRATIQEIGDSYYNLIDKNSKDPAIPVLEKILDEREAKGEVYKPKETENTSNEEPVETIEPTKESQISVIKPGEINKPDIVPLKTKENASSIESSTQVGEQPIGSQSTGGSRSEGMGRSNEGEVPPGKGVPKEGEGSSQKDLTGITHAQMDETAKEFGLETYNEDPETVKEWDDAADKRIKDNPKAIPELLDKMRNGDQPDKVEQRMMLKYISDLKARVRENPSDENLTALKRAKDLSNIVGGREVAKSLRARQGSIEVEHTLPDDLVEKMETLGVDKLTEKQKEETTKLFTDEEKANKAYEEKIAKLEEENTKLRAAAEVKNMKNKSPEKMTHEQRVANRKKILEDARAALLKVAKGEGGAMSSIPGAAQLIAIAPHVKNYAKELIGEGIDNLPRLVKAIHDEFKNILDGISEKDIHNILAGEHDTKKPTRTQLAIQMNALQIQANLINKLERLEAGQEPKSEKKQRQRNKEIADLRKQIKEHDLQKLSEYKNRVQSQIKKVEEQIKNKQYTTEKPKAPIKLDEEAIALQDKLIKTRNARALAKFRDYYESQSKYEKGVRYAADILNIPRALMSSLDFSAMLRQGVIPSASHPGMSLEASSEMFKSAFSQKNYDRWFFDLQNMPRYDDMVKNGLGITDSTDPHLQAREELFMSNLADKIPVVGKLVKGSERAYSMYLNKIRVDLYNNFATAMEKRGLTTESNPKQYKELANYINNATGRGSVNAAIEPVIPLMNSVFFSPRLIASRINMLTYWMQLRLYRSVPKEVRAAYFKDMASFIGVGMTVLALAKYGFGAEVELNPRSADFGKIKSGRTRWDIWGGFQPYARVAAQVATGKRKSTNTGKISELNGKKAFGATKMDVATTFFRGKLAPIPSLGVDMLSGRNMIGDEYKYKLWGAKPGEKDITDMAMEHLVPMTITGMKDAYSDQGAKEWFNILIPSLLGVGTQTYEVNPKKHTKK